MGQTNQNPQYRQVIYDKEQEERFRQLTLPVSRAELEKVIHYDHIDVFNEAVRHLGLFILIRRTNEQSIKFINYRGFVPKPLLCKPKTAKTNVRWRVNGKDIEINCAGLVVNPYLVSIGAFNNNWEEYQKALQTWDKYWGNGVPPGFAVQTNVESNYFGCVMRTGGGYYGGVLSDKSAVNHVYAHHTEVQKTKTMNANGRIETQRFMVPRLSNQSNSYIDRDALKDLPPGGAYIHGDYDLYALIHKDHLNERNPIKGTFEGQDHTKSPYWEQFKTYVNGKMSLDMVQHGSQEHFSKHSDEVVDIFAPFDAFDLRYRKVVGIAGLIALYEKMFHGRQTV